MNTRKPVCWLRTRKSNGEVDTDFDGPIKHADLFIWEPLYREFPYKLPAQNDALSEAIHYPNCWDTAAYPTLESALSEVYHDFKCTEESCPDKQEPAQVDSPEWGECKRICDIPQVHEALADFSNDSCEDSAICLIREILRHTRPADSAKPFAWVCGDDDCLHLALQRDCLPNTRNVRALYLHSDDSAAMNAHFYSRLSKWKKSILRGSGSCNRS